VSRPSTAQCWYKFNRNEAYTVLQHALRDKQLQCFASVFQSSEEPCRPTGQMHLVQTLCICIAVRSHWAVRMTMGWAPNKRWTAPHRPPKAIVPLTRKAMRQSSASECPMPYQPLHAKPICHRSHCSVLSVQGNSMGKALYVCFVAAP